MAREADAALLEAYRSYKVIPYTMVFLSGWTAKYLRRHYVATSGCFKIVLFPHVFTVAPVEEGLTVASTIHRSFVSLISVCGNVFSF